MVDPTMPHESEDNEPIIHYCWVCGVEEQCREEQCDFREQFKVHGYCMALVRRIHERNGNILDQNKRLIDMIQELISKENDRRA